MNYFFHEPNIHYKIAPPLFPIAHAHRKPTSSASVSQSGLWPTSVKSHIVLILRGLAVKTLYNLYQYSLNTSVSREFIGAVFMKTPRRATKPAFLAPPARKPGSRLSGGATPAAPGRALCTAVHRNYW